MATVKTRVIRGIKWLDENVEDKAWWMLIDVDGCHDMRIKPALDMADPCDCVFGAVFHMGSDSKKDSGYLVGMEKLRQQKLSSRDLGFDSNGQPGDLKQFEKEWIRWIRERQWISRRACAPLYERKDELVRERYELKKRIAELEKDQS